MDPLNGDGMDWWRWLLRNVVSGVGGWFRAVTGGA